MANIIESIFEDILKEVSKAKEVETSLYTMSYHDIGVKAFNAAEIALKQVKEKYLSEGALSGNAITNVSLTPQEYLEIVTGKVYFINADNQVEQVEEILVQEGFSLWSYPLSELNYVVETGLKVVLVECVNVTDKGLEKAYRLFEVPDSVTSESVKEYFE